MKIEFHEEEIRFLRKLGLTAVEAALNSCPHGFATRWDIVTHQPLSYDRDKFSFGNYLMWYLEYWGFVEQVNRPLWDSDKNRRYTYWQITYEGSEFMSLSSEEKNAFINERVVKELSQYV